MTACEFDQVSDFDIVEDADAFDLEVPVRVGKGHYQPAAAAAAAYALGWVPFAAAVSAVRALLGASHEDLRLRAHLLSRSLSRAFLFDGAAQGQLMPLPFAACDRFQEEGMYVCVDRPPFCKALQDVNRALMQVSVKDASHGPCDCYYDTVGDLMRLLVDDAGVGRAVMDQAAFESAFALEWVPV